MRVLHLTDRLSDRGGAHRHLLGVVDALRENGHEVFVAAGAVERRLSEALTLGVPVVAWESGGVSEWHPGPLAAWGDVPGLGRALGRQWAREPSRPRASIAGA